MSANSWREMTETVAPDVRHCAKDKYVCPPPQTDHNKEWGPRRDPPPSLLFIFSADWPHIKHWDMTAW